MPPQHAQFLGQAEHWQQMFVDKRVGSRSVAVGIVQLMHQHVEHADGRFGVGANRRVVERIVAVGVGDFVLQVAAALRIE